MSTFLGTFGTETFRRAQGGKFVVSSDSGKPVLNWASFSTCKRWHRNQSEVQGRAGLRDFVLWPIPLRLSKLPDSLVTFKMPTPKLDPGDLDLPRCSAIAPSIGRAFLSQEQDLMRAAQAEQTLHGQVAGPGFLVLALELA